MQASLGCHVMGNALPMACSSWPGSQPAAIFKRLGTSVPSSNRFLLRRLRTFVRVWIRRHLSPLSERVEFDEWLEHTNYPAWRKEQLRITYESSCGVVRRRDYACKSFVKTETYSGYKYPRAINSRSDVFKCKTGPLFHAIEQVLFKLPYFVKFVPVAERSAFIHNRLHGWHKFIATDYTSFEALFTPELMRAVEFQLYSYMGRQCYREEVGIIQEALAGRNHMVFGSARASVNGVRMSGDMCTSLGNGFSNLMIMLFLCRECGIDVDGVVEGDDGIFGVSAVPPVRMFTELGLKIKLQEFGVLGDAGFCKQYFDAGVQENVTDPTELLVKFGWTHSNRRGGATRVLRGLLKAKAFSLKAELPNAPVARSLWRYALRMTTGYRAIYDWDYYHQVPSGDAVLREIDMRSRLLVERLFGFPIGHQLAVEAYLDAKTDLAPLPEWVIPHGKPDWSDYYWKYQMHGAVGF